MEPQAIVASLRENLRERPYWTTAAFVGVGWLLGRSLPLRAVLAVAGIGARAAVASALEDAVRQRVFGEQPQPDEERAA
jgi:lauroyl/myristoyl acyltransferase